MYASRPRLSYSVTTLRQEVAKLMNKSRPRLSYSVTTLRRRVIQGDLFLSS